MGNSTDYNKRYYEKRKKDISIKRKRQYWDNIEKREGLKKKARDNYRRNQGSDGKKGSSRKYTVKMKDGKALYTMRYLEEVTGKKQEALRHMEKNGYIPKSVYTDSRGWRMYTEEQVKALSSQLLLVDTGEQTLKDMGVYLASVWEKLA